MLESLNTGNSQIRLENMKIENGEKITRLKEILTVSDIKFSKFLEKIENKDIKELENNNKSKLLIIGRKNGRKR